MIINLAHSQFQLREQKKLSCTGSHHLEIVDGVSSASQINGIKLMALRKLLALRATIIEARMEDIAPNTRETPRSVRTRV